jgi:cytochrome b561
MLIRLVIRVRTQHPPADFDAFTPRIAHGLITPLPGFLILGHIAAARYHQFIRRDGLFRRMWFGNRTR